MLHIFLANKISLQIYQRESEWKVEKLSLNFNALERLDSKPDIDLFASRINHQFPKYVSYRPDQEAFAIDAFSLDWSNFNFYAFPPFSVIPIVLSLFRLVRPKLSPLRSVRNDDVI